VSAKDITDELVRQVADDLPSALLNFERFKWGGVRRVDL